MPDLVDLLEALAGPQRAIDPGAVRARVLRRRRRRRIVGLTSVCALVAAITTGVLVGRDDGRSQREIEVVDPGPDGTGVGEWTTLPPGPVDGRSFASMVWTGTELIVWGGEAGSETDARNSGAAYDPAAGTWRAMPDAPIAPRSTHAAVWTGEEMIVCCGGVDPLGPIGAYDPGSNQWRTLEQQSEIETITFPAAVWTGERMIVAGGVEAGVSDTESASMDGALEFDPATNSWQGMAGTSPVTLGGQPAAMWTGREMLVVPRVATAIPPVAYDPATDGWRTLPEPPADLAIHQPSAVWTGTEVILWGVSQAPVGGQYRALGASLDVEHGTWRRLADAPLGPVDWWEGTPGSNSAIWDPAGQRMIVYTGAVGAGSDVDGSAPMLAYYPARDAWQALPDLPESPHHPTLTLAANQLIVASGSGFYALDLPAPDETSPVGQCMALSAGGLPSTGKVGAPIADVLPGGIQSGFAIGELYVLQVDDDSFETPWYAITAAISDADSRVLGVGLWLSPDPIVTYGGSGSAEAWREAPWLAPEDSHLEAANALAQTASVWTPSHGHLDAGQVDAAVACVPPPLAEVGTVNRVAPFTVTVVPGDQTGFTSSFAPLQPVAGPGGLVVAGIELEDATAPRPALWWSANGHAWEGVSTDAFDGLLVGSLVATADRYLAVGIDTTGALAHLYSSVDGRTWDLALDVSGGTETLGTLVGTGDRFFRLRTTGLLTSSDGTTWEPASFASAEIDVSNAIIGWTGSSYLLLQTDASQTLTGAWRSDDGVAWTQLATPPAVTVAGLAGKDGNAVIAFRDTPKPADCGTYDPERGPPPPLAGTGCRHPIRLAVIDPATGAFDPNSPVAFTSHDPGAWLTVSAGHWIATQRDDATVIAWTSPDGQTWTPAEPPIALSESWSGGVRASQAGAITLLDDQTVNEPPDVALLDPPAPG